MYMYTVPIVVIISTCIYVHECGISYTCTCRFVIHAIILLMIIECAKELLYWTSHCIYNHDLFLYQTERPAFEKEATKNLQEENNELHQQVSLLSQWNDKHQKTITSLEIQMEGLEEEKRQILVELMKIQSFEQVQYIHRKHIHLKHEKKNNF